MIYAELKSKLDLAIDEANNKGNCDLADQLANEVKVEISELSELNQDTHDLTSKVFYILSMTAYKRGRYDEAISFAQSSLDIAKKYSLLQAQIKSWIVLGIVNFSLGYYQLALEHYSKALKVQEKIDDKSGLAAIIGNIGNVYQSIGSNELALEYYNRALIIYEELGDKSRIAHISGSIGASYFCLNALDEALKNFTSALSIDEELKNRAGIAYATGNLGAIYFSLGHKDKALEHFKMALDLDEELGNKQSLANVIGNLGKIYADKKFEVYDPVIAENYLIQAKALNESIKYKLQLYKSHLALANFYEQENRLKESLSHFKQYNAIEKEVQSEESKKQAEQMEYRRKIEESERDRQVKLARFQEQEKILLNILPSQIAERILEGEKRIADLHEHVSVFFSDIVGFTKLSQTISPDELLTMLNEIFSEFDRIARKHGLEKIKTIGDAYMAVAGVPLAQEDHAERAAGFALEVIEYMKAYRKASNSELQIRVGLHCGKAIAGVIGENKFAYDLWGDSVNTASRMESHGEAGRIHVSEDFRNALKNSNFQLTDRGEMEVKGKGKMKTYFLEKET